MGLLRSSEKTLIKYSLNVLIVLTIIKNKHIKMENNYSF